MTPAARERQVVFVINAAGATPTAHMTTLRRMARRFAEDQLPSTWIVDSASIVEAIAPVDPSAAATDFALSVESPQNDSKDASLLAGAEWRRRLEALRRKVDAVGTIYVPSDSDIRGKERRLSEMGIGAVVAERVSASASVRPLPFGISLFAAEVAVPVRRRWPGVFARSCRYMGQHQSPLCTAVVSVAQLQRLDERGWRQVDRLLEEAVAARDRDEVEATTVAAISTIRAGGANCPQRSILRAA